MENKIVPNLENPEKLERIYRLHKSQFKDWLTEAIEKNPDSETLNVWNARINYSPVNPEDVDIKKLFLTFILSVLSFAILKIPSITPVSENWFYPRFSATAIISSLTAYFLVTRTNSYGQRVLIVCCTLFSAIFMALLPDVKSSDSIVMSQIHMPLFLLSVLAISFMCSNWKSAESRLIFIRYLGEVIIYGTIILLGGMVLTGITIGLFDRIGFSIEQWYMQYIVVLGLAAAPIVATYLYDTVLKQISNMANIIANTFSPLFLATVVCYLVAMFCAKKSLYANRDFFIIFNGLLVLVWAITVFSIAGKSKNHESTLVAIVNISLISTTLVVNGVGLSAILFRLSEYGVSPNKVVVTGSNILIFFHLILILIAYFKKIKTGQPEILTSSIAVFLPVYTGWSFLVATVLPFIFNFK